MSLSQCSETPSAQREGYLGWSAGFHDFPCFHIIAELRKSAGSLATDDEPDGALVAVHFLMDLPRRNHIDKARRHVESALVFQFRRAGIDGVVVGAPVALDMFTTRQHPIERPGRAVIMHEGDRTRALDQRVQDKAVIGILIKQQVGGRPVADFGVGLGSGVGLEFGCRQQDAQFFADLVP